MAGRPRSFVCPDDLWAACERAAWQSGRPVDDVVTEALRRFMQGAQTAGPPPPPPPAPPPPGPPPFPPTLVAGHAPAPFPGPPPMRPPSAAPPPPPMHAPPPPPPPMPHYGATPMPPPGYGPPPMPPPVQPSTVTPPAPGGYGRPYGAQAAPPPFPSPPAPPGGPQSVADGPPAYPIFLYCEGERAQIMQPRFIIGRSRNASDFAINDSNVSRQHAAVEWLRGHYHIVDMGSTNGIQFQGRRIERKVIYDGDVIILAGHTLRFARQ